MGGKSKRYVELSFYKYSEAKQDDVEYTGGVEVTDDDISDYLEENGMSEESEDFSYDDWLEETRYHADSFSDFLDFLTERYKDDIIEAVRQNEENAKWDRRLP